MMRLVFIFVVALSGLSSCSGNDDVPLDAPDTTGLFTRTISHDEVTRQFILYVPDSLEGTSRVPLMLNFHGFGGTANRHLRSADMRSLADSGKFILVYPQGALLEGNPHWNAGLKTDTNKSDADDFGFVRALIDEISSEYNIDPARVYACGYSNGAFFAYALACYHGDIIAAIGSVAGTMMEETYDECNPSHPTAMINIHGTSDAYVPYGGAEGLKSIDDVLAYWTGFNNTVAVPTVNRVNDRALSIERHSYSDGDKNTSVEHYKVIDGGHVWFDINYDGANTSALIWNFVSRYDINGLR